MFKGVDISNIQGTVNYTALAASGVSFVILRCGIGNDGVDSMYSKNLAEARAAGLQVACYHFVYPLPVVPGKESRSPQAQAQAHFKAAQGVLACMDFEWPEEKDWAAWGCTAAQINQWGLDYLAEYSSLIGQPMIIYTYPNYAQTVQITSAYAQYPLWIASYEPTPTIPTPWNSWVLWQNTGGGGKLPNGAPVDTDLAPDLSLWNVNLTEPLPNVVAVSPNNPNPPDPMPLPVVVNPPVVPVVTAPASPAISDNIFTNIVNAVANFLNGLGKK